MKTEIRSVVSFDVFDVNGGYPAYGPAVSAQKTYSHEVALSETVGSTSLVRLDKEAPTANATGSREQDVLVQGERSCSTHAPAHLLLLRRIDLLARKGGRHLRTGLEIPPVIVQSARNTTDH